MIEAASSVRLQTSPQELFELVLDLRAYSQIDRKIRKIYANPPVAADGSGVVEYRGAMRGLPGPRQRNAVALQRWTSLTFTSDGGWLADRVMSARGSFSVLESGDGWCEVEHRYVFAFKGPLGPLMDRFCGSWLARDLSDELERLRLHFAGTPKCDGSGRRQG